MPGQLPTPTPVGAGAPSYLRGIVRFLVYPPDWAAPVLLVAILLGVGAVGYRWHQQQPNVEQYGAMAANLWAGAAFFQTTWALVHFLPLSYELAVLAGVASGFVLWWFTVDWIVKIVEDVVLDYRKQQPN